MKQSKSVYIIYRGVIITPIFSLGLARSFFHDLQFASTLGVYIFLAWAWMDVFHFQKHPIILYSLCIVSSAQVR